MQIMAAIIAHAQCLQSLRVHYISLVVAALACTLYYRTSAYPHVRTHNIIWGRGFHLSELFSHYRRG